MADETIGAAEFRITFHKLEAPTVVTSHGLPIGTWVPATTTLGTAPRPVPDSKGYLSGPVPMTREAAEDEMARDEAIASVALDRGAIGTQVVKPRLGGSFGQSRPAPKTGSKK